MNLQQDNKTLALLDTAIATYNLGDEIIMDGVNAVVHTVFKDYRCIRIPTHEKISRAGLSIIRNSDIALLGGSNILSSSMNRYRQWNINLLQALLFRKKVVLLGVGWRNYQGKPNWYTRLLLKNALSSDYMHSVRDSYTQQKLTDMGIHNVINTGCPTMWNLKPGKQAEAKKSSVVFTLTDYDRDNEKDAYFIQVLLEQYQEVYFWPQGKKDLDYLKGFESLTKDITVLPPSLSAYDAFLSEIECDYIGTRLHGGIRALQFGKRTIIIGIDNRATEKQRDFNLFVLSRQDISKLADTINIPFSADIQLPSDNIQMWIAQFKTR